MNPTDADMHTHITQQRANSHAHWRSIRSVFSISINEQTHLSYTAIVFLPPLSPSHTHSPSLFSLSLSLCLSFFSLSSLSLSLSLLSPSLLPLSFVLAFNDRCYARVLLNGEFHDATT
eukprot:m.372981 g.372981  ORF g.372981 m.372981 type:complete len:118 (+) comp65288_c0_seq1:82-435(+)